MLLSPIAPIAVVTMAYLLLLQSHDIFHQLEVVYA